MYFDKEKFRELRDKANSVNLVDYLQHSGVDLVRKGHEYSTREHDSLSINYEKNCWRQYSQIDPRTGKTLSGDPISYLQRFEHMTFMEAVGELVSFGYGPNEMLENKQPIKPSYTQLRIEDAKPKGPVQLPEKEKGSWRQLFGYLCQGRCLDKEIVQECISNKSLYLSKDHHNAVFVTYDDAGVPRYATQRGTLSDKPFKGDCGTESDKSYGWMLKGNPKSDLVYVVEAPIDAMSIATLEKMHGRDYHQHTKLSLGCVWDGALERYLKHNPQIKRIRFGTDDDKAGNKAADQYMKKYAARGYDVARIKPTVIKDFNDMLVHEKAPSREHSQTQQTQMR